MGYSSSLGPPAGEAKIVVIAYEEDNTLVELERLPEKATFLFRGINMEEFSTPEGKQALAEANALLIYRSLTDLLRQLLPLAPKLAWIHSCSAGVDSILLPEVVENDGIVLTNVRGVFSSSLAEYCVLSCLYFAKDVGRWTRNQAARKWEQFTVSEITGATLGVVGYGDIGQACARKAKAMGMKIIAQRRRPELSRGDGLADEVLGDGEVGDVIAKSDYVVVAAALTRESRGMIGSAELARAKPHTVIISLGRGTLIDEEAMTLALQEGRLRGAALDVFCTEPLPKESPLWGMENVLISSHNAVLVANVMNDSVRLFVDNVANFIAGEQGSMHLVDKRAGY